MRRRGPDIEALEALGALEIAPKNLVDAVTNLASEWRRLDKQRSRWTSHVDDSIASLEAVRRQIADTDRPRVDDRIADIIRASHSPDHPAVRRLDRDDQARMRVVPEGGSAHEGTA